MQEIIVKNINGEPKVIVHRTNIHDGRAQIALDLIKGCSMFGGMPDGEDSNGRQKIKVLTPEELVARAFEVADRAVSEIERRGWFTKAPTWTEMEEQIKK